MACLKKGLFSCHNIPHPAIFLAAGNEGLWSPQIWMCHQCAIRKSTASACILNPLALFPPTERTQDRSDSYKHGFIFLLSLSLMENMSITPPRINNPTANLPTPWDSLLKLVKGCRRCADCSIRVISTVLLLLKRGSITFLSQMTLKHNILPHVYLPTYSIYIKYK